MDGSGEIDKNGHYFTLLLQWLPNQSVLHNEPASIINGSLSTQAQLFVILEIGRSACRAALVRLLLYKSQSHCPISTTSPLLQQLKFRYGEKAKKIEKISHLVLTLLSNVKIRWDIFSNFVVFSQYLNFTYLAASYFILRIKEVIITWAIVCFSNRGK